MNARERNLLYVLLGILAAGGAAVGVYNWFLKPLNEANAKLEELTEEVFQKERQVEQIKQDRLRLEQARKLSLPGNPDKALTEYAKFLRPVLRDSGLTDIEITAPPPPAETKVTPGAAKKAGHVSLAYQVRAKGGLKELVTAMEKIRRTPVMHRVKSFTLDRADSSGKDTTGKLNIQMTVECLIVHQAPAQNQPSLKPDYSVRLPNDTAPRFYTDIAKNNVFTGPLPPPPPQVTKQAPPVVDEGPDVREFIRLVSTNPTAQEAHLRNLIFKSRETRLRSAPMSGYDFFTVSSEEGRPLFKGKVLRIDQRDVYFQVRDDIYGIHIGQSLADAMKRPLNDQELKTLDLIETTVDKKSESAGKDASTKGGKSGKATN